MKYPFLTSYKNKLYVKLNKSLYDEKAIQQAKQDEPQTVISVNRVKDYYLVELNPDSEDDYFDFLNFLISYNRNQ
tara:strand:- start:362 stop:586 length:225 start_codon:yes stop_codon:yes gene_type:complete